MNGVQGNITFTYFEMLAQRLGVSKSILGFPMDIACRVGRWGRRASVPLVVCLILGGGLPAGSQDYSDLLDPLNLAIADPDDPLLETMTTSTPEIAGFQVAALAETATGVGTGLPVSNNAGNVLMGLNQKMNNAQNNVRLWWKEQADSMRWMTDVLEAYRTIELAKSAYEAVAHFDLMNHMNVIDILPVVPLPNGFIFGDQTQTTPVQVPGGSGGPMTIDTSLALQFTYQQGGVAATFNNWGQFKPNLNINVGQLVSQLGNINFGAAEMTQLNDGTNHPLATVYRTVDPTQRLGMITSFYNSILASVQNFDNFMAQKQAAQNAANSALVALTQNYTLQIARETAELQAAEVKSVTDMQNDAALAGIQLPNVAGLQNEWTIRQASLSLEQSRRMAILQAEGARRIGNLNQLYAAIQVVKSGHSGMQTAAQCLKTVEQCKAAQRDAEGKYQAERQKFLQSLPIQMSGSDFTDIGKYATMNAQGWQTLEAARIARDTAITTAESDMRAALERFNQLAKIEKDGKGFENLQDNILGSLTTIFATNAAQTDMAIEAAFQQAEDEIDAIRYQEVQDEESASVAAIQNLGDIINTYMSTYIYNYNNSGQISNSSMQNGGLPVYIVLTTVETYANALKVAFGGSSIGTLMTADSQTAQAAADKSYTSYLTSLFTVQS